MGFSSLLEATNPDFDPCKHTRGCFGAFPTSLDVLFWTWRKLVTVSLMLPVGMLQLCGLLGFFPMLLSITNSGHSLFG